MKRFFPTFLFLMPLLMLTGCPEKPVRNNPDTVHQLTAFQSPKASAYDPQPEPEMLVNLSIYRILVPSRTISRNEEFWKHAIEDEPLDVKVRDRLLANGFRVGIASRADWSYFKEALEQYPVISQMTGTASSVASNIELPMRTGLTTQRILWMHPTHGLVGDLYDKSDNVMTLYFQPIRRRPGDVRLSLTPMIRAERTEIKYTIRNETQELNFVRPEYFFDLRLTADIPLDHFLIISPSSEADAVSSLGQAFLYQEKSGQQFEQLILISPQPFQLNAPATKPATKPVSAAANK